MKNNKIVSLIALLLMLLPVFQLQAEESSGGAGTSANGDVKTEGSAKVDRPVLKSFFQTGDKPGMEQREKGGADVDVDSNTSLKSDGRVSGEGRANMNAAIKLRTDEIMKRIGSIKGEIRVKLEAKAQDRVKKILEYIFARFSKQIDRLANIDARIGVKINALASAGTDVVALKAQYSLAQTALAKARVDVEAAHSASLSVTATESSKEGLRAIVKTAEDSIKSTAEAYRKTIALIPEIHAEATTNSSATVGQ